MVEATRGGEAAAGETVEYRPDSPPSGERDGLVTMALVAGRGRPQFRDEIRILLLGRLRIVAIVGLIAAILYTAISLPGWYRGQALFGSVAADGAFVGLDLFATASLVVVLYGRRALSYARLRSVESLLFGLYMALYAVFIFVPTRGGALAKYEPLGWAVGYYAMEYLPGMTLEQLVGRFGPQGPARAIHLLRPVCGALCEAQAAGLVHRDIKPSNIVICERGRRRDVAKLLDFGLVLATGPRGSAGAAESGIVGTPAYMAPEQAAGLDLLDARADLYGLGAIGYFLLTGDPPFPKVGLWRVLAAHQTEPATFPDRLAGDLPADVKAVVLRCLEKDPARRDPDADSVERALAACSCAGSWTLDEADDWWRENAPDGAPQPDQTQRRTDLLRDEDGP